MEQQTIGPRWCSGARNLGGAIDCFLAGGLNLAGFARSADTLNAISARGAFALEADAAETDQLGAVISKVRERFGTLDVVVNAVSPVRLTGDGRFGGGTLGDADLAACDRWAEPVARQAFTFLSASIRALRSAGAGGTLIQITGGASRSARPGLGLWAAGRFSTRAMI